VLYYFPNYCQVIWYVQEENKRTRGTSQMPISSLVDNGYQSLVNINQKRLATGALYIVARKNSAALC
jgi:hypothetical protein